ncbi:PIG-L family deacetylase [Nocardia sp. NPDC005366]|uniref:PIG-L deacetylase family protein n=1 Tax=Nocardia sp. NPDC005366 TaxID=3156878 RepID=UPI00339FB51A
MTSIERFAERDPSEPGTPIEVWRPWIQRLASIDAIELAGERLQIVAPHPDDEVLGTGALAAFLTDRGVPVSIIAVTDGEASHPDSPTHSPAELAAIRRNESAAAGRVLGIERITRLGLPDGAVAENEDQLTALLTDSIETGATVAIPLRNDGHPDHEATARAGAAAARERGARVIEYPIWMWHWSFPDDPAIDWRRARRLILPTECAARKRRATAQFHSQLRPLSEHPADRPVLGPHVVRRLLDLDEVVLV